MDDRVSYDYAALKGKDKGLIAKLAKRGERHPDPAIAQLAYGWAVWFMANKGDTAGLGEKIDLLFQVAFAAVTKAPGSIDNQSILQRRLARRLVALGPPPA